MRRLFLVVMLLALAGAGAVQAEGKLSFGLWEGQRDVGYLYYFSFFVSTISALEGGAYLHWDVADNLGLRLQASYLKGSSSNSETDIYRNSEYKYELTGFPVQLQVLPTARVGDRLVFRAGAGLTYYKLTGKGSNVSGSTTTILPQHAVTGLGGQLLLIAEGRLNKNIGLEAQYEKGTAKLSYTYTWALGGGGSPPTTEKVTFGLPTEAYRLGLAFHF